MSNKAADSLKRMREDDTDRGGKTHDENRNKTHDEKHDTERGHALFRGTLDSTKGFDIKAGLELEGIIDDRWMPESKLPASPGTGTYDSRESRYWKLAQTNFLKHLEGEGKEHQRDKDKHRDEDKEEYKEEERGEGECEPNEGEGEGEDNAGKVEAEEEDNEVFF